MSLRILTDNRADSATLSASGAVAGRGVENLKSDLRGDFCRVVGSSTQIVATWPEAVPVGAVVLPQSTLGPSSTIRVRLYSGAALKWDSGEQWANAGTTTVNEDWTEELNDNYGPASGNEFGYFMSNSTAVYLHEQLMADQVVINITDQDSNTIDISRLLIGPYFEPRLNAAYGQASQLIDMSTHARTASGSLRTDRGPLARSLAFDLSYVHKEDRGRVQRLMERSIGKSVWVSLCAGAADKELERDKSIYGRVTQPSAMRWVNFGQHSASFQIEGL